MNRATTSSTNAYSPSANAYSYVSRKVRRKTDWAGIGIGDAFKRTIDYFMRMSAQRLFYKACKKVQQLSAALACEGTDEEPAPKVKPQLGPCYTTYPAALSAYAAIGLTGFLEFEARSSDKVLYYHLSEYLDNPQKRDMVPVNPAIYKRVVSAATQTVQTRLLLEDLSRSQALSSVELYRLFSASQQNMKFSTLSEILNAVILFGDILPDWRELNLHPMTRALFRDLDEVCQPYFKQISEVESIYLVKVGASWVREVSRCLAGYLPGGEEHKKWKEEAKERPPYKSPENEKDASYKFGDEEAKEDEDIDHISPLDGPHPPSLTNPMSGPERALNSLIENLLGNKGKDPEDAEAIKESSDDVAALRHFANAVDEAAGQKSEWEDMRSDLVEQVLRHTGFNEGPIQGDPTEGHEVTVNLGGDKEAGGEIFDRAVSLSEDHLAHEKLLQESEPVAEQLTQILYPNVEELPIKERLCTAGSLDPSRLAMIYHSSAIFKRVRVQEQADRRGQPVLVIACDGSGSLDSQQMQMVKVLASAWLRSTTKSRIKLLAGLYHSGEIRQGITAPLVQWIYHPHKTPATSRKEATRAVVTLPDNGTGIQSDALSLAFMLDEAKAIARGRMIYLILITDCEWNRSFNTVQSGTQEMMSLLEEQYADLEGRLHITLVALGVDEETGFEDRVDKLIRVPEGKLSDYRGVAENIGVYVASCMKARRQLIGRT